MPNWCENSLSITCDKEQVEQIKAKLVSINQEDGEFYVDFNKLIPLPETLLNTIATFNFSYQLFQMKQTKRFRIGEIKKFIRPSEHKRIRTLAKHHRWTIARFLHWLEKRPKEQERLGIDFALSK